MWKKAEDDVIMGGRFRKENNGNLHILVSVSAFLKTLLSYFSNRLLNE